MPRNLGGTADRHLRITIRSPKDISVILSLMLTAEASAPNADGPNFWACSLGVGTLCSVTERATYNIYMPLVADV